MITWNAKLSNGHAMSGLVDDGSWKTVQAKLDTEHIRIVSLKLLGAGTGAIDDNCDGYFIGQKIMAQAFTGEFRDMVGVGYWKKHSNMVRIKWYNKNDFNLITSEAKPVSECGFLFVKNPS